MGPTLVKAVGITQLIAVHSRTVYFAIKGKKEWQNSFRLFFRFYHYFAVDLAIILP